jgi:putative ABC transport system substrate-binding protein
LQEITRTIPIVMAQAVDPVGLGTVRSMARPGNNTTGFTQFEYGLSAKWFELLREVAPQVTRVGFVRDRGAAVSLGQWAVIGAAATPLGLEILPVDVAIGDNPEGAMTEFARGPNDGLIVGVGTAATVQRDQLVVLAARHKLPTVYPYRFFVEAGGLMSYGPSLIDMYRRTGDYVARILKGENAGDLPIQAPTKYVLSINLKTAKSLGSTVPPALLARADEVIE